MQDLLAGLGQWRRSARKVNLAAEVTKESFHERLVRSALRDALSDDDAMLLFCLLHTCEIEVELGVLSESTRTVVAPITQRHASEVIASLYGRKKRDEYRANPAHWYWQWNGEWGGYDHAEQLSENESKRLQELRSQLQVHPWVYEIRDEN